MNAQRRVIKAVAELVRLGVLEHVIIDGKPGVRLVVKKQVTVNGIPLLINFEDNKVLDEPKPFVFDSNKGDDNGNDGIQRVSTGTTEETDS